MGWMETCAKERRTRFAMAAAEGEETSAGLCGRFGVSRKTGYKWLQRYDEGWVANVEDRPRAPLSHPHALPAGMPERCIEVRQAHPTRGRRQYGPGW
ncbi:MAG: helix-turn-helix domain-containing protein [Acetobacteraceae bacterium]